MTRDRGAWAVACALCTACAAAGPRSAFDHRFADNRPDATRQVAERLSRPQLPEAIGSPWVVGTTDPTAGDRERAVVAYDLQTGAQRWQMPLRALTRPQIVGDLVILAARGDGEEIVALDDSTGRIRWRTSTEGLGHLGCARGGATVVCSASIGAAGGADRRSMVRALDASTGRTRWDHHVDGILGAPAATDEFAFVPWDRQNLVILDLGSGAEQARLRSTDDVIAWVYRDSTGMFYGARGVYRFSRNSFTGRKADSTYRAPPVEGVPTRPLFFEDGFFPTPGVPSARGRIRLYAQPRSPTDAVPIPLVGDTAYYVYYRYVFAFTPEGPLRWVRVLDQAVVGASVSEAGLVTVGERGGTQLLAATTGNDRWTVALPTAGLASASIAATGFAPEGPDGDPRDLPADLRTVASDPDNGLVAARAFAIAQLASDEDAEVTGDLLALYQRPSMPRTLRETIKTELASRDTGAQHLIGALEQRFDFLEETKAPPLAVIAPALARMNATEGVEPLSEHLFDHETPLDALPEIIRALVQLGQDQAAPTLARFLRLYHRDSTFRDAPAALLEAAAGLFEHGGDEARDELEQLAAHHGAAPSLVEGIHARIEGERAHERSQELAESQAAAEREAEEAAAAARAAEAEKPDRLTQDMIDYAVFENLHGVRDCVAEERLRNPRLSQVRLTFILNGNGSSEAWRFTPNREEFVECIEPSVSAIEFPSFRERRMPAVVTINLRPRDAPREPEDPFEADAPWWVRYRAQNEVSPSEADPIPWWVPRQAPAPTSDDSAAETPPDAASSPTADGEDLVAPSSEEEVPAWWHPQAN